MKNNRQKIYIKRSFFPSNHYWHNQFYWKKINFIGFTQKILYNGIVSCNIPIKSKYELQNIDNCFHLEIHWTIHEIQYMKNLKRHLSLEMISLIFFKMLYTYQLKNSWNLIFCEKCNTDATKKKHSISSTKHFSWCHNMS